VSFYVYCMASGRNGTLYLGVTNDLVRRVYQHKTKALGGFTAQYGVNQLVWYECYDDAITAIARKGTQEMAPRVEARIDREGESGLD